MQGETGCFACCISVIIGFTSRQCLQGEHFDILLDFLQEAQLDRVGCFQYSPVEGARANDLPNHVAPELMQERWDRFMATQQAISAAKLQAKVGTTQEILIDEVTADGALGRSTADAPEIDGLVHLPGITNLQPGDLVEAEISAAQEYDLFVELLGSHFCGKDAGFRNAGPPLSRE